MKKIVKPTINDNAAIIALSNNSNLSKSSYPHLKNNLTLIRWQYRHYNRNRGDATKIVRKPIPSNLKDGLLKNYRNPPKELPYINDLRDSTPNVCPMCGSVHTFTLDHFLPKADYPEWTVFSNNLVPACQCNLKRGNTLLGNLALGERVLHPFYDSVLSRRNISCLITTNDNFRLVKMEIVCIAPMAIREREAIEFHIKEVVVKAGIVRSLEDHWPGIRKNPPSVVNTIPRNSPLANIQDLHNKLQDQLDNQDDRYGTPNNWESILIHGIIHSPGVAHWLLQRHNDILSGVVAREDE